jgi:hypothetical protein
MIYFLSLVSAEAAIPPVAQRCALGIVQGPAFAGIGQRLDGFRPKMRKRGLDRHPIKSTNEMQ